MCFIRERQWRLRTFRVGNIGEIYSEDIEKVAGIMKEFLEERRR